MAWLQNLAGHAENLLNKIDQNAATVLNEGNKSVVIDEEIGRDTFEEPHHSFQSVAITEKTSSGSLKGSRSPTPESSSKLTETRLDTVTTVSESSKTRKSDVPATDEVKTERSVKSSHTSVSSTSRRNSFVTAQELELLHSKVAQLELENRDLYKQFLNIQHLYSEIRNENISLQFKVDRLNEQLASAQSEKEQYVARAQRILQEKEKLISLNQGDQDSNEQENNIFMTYNEELKKELEFQQMKVSELTEKNSKLLSDLHSLQIQHQVIQQGLNQSNQQLEQNLASEKRLRSIAEDDCNQKVKELQQCTQEVEHLNGIIKQAQEENTKLKEAIQRKVQHSESDEYENRIKSLTQALMLKQNTLETVTTERNALRLQLEKLEPEYRRNLEELKREKVKVIHIPESADDRMTVPHFMRVSPHDAGVTRRVKHAYSTLDAISIRTGIFLRRYPLARVFVFFYMMILHFWVFTVLLWDVPSNR